MTAFLQVMYLFLEICFTLLRAKKVVPDSLGVLGQSTK